MSSEPRTLLLPLHARTEIVHDTLAFSFERPQDFTFKPGQSMDVTLLDPPETDAEGNTRAFSIASAPDEPLLTFATRLRDTAFKRTLRNLPLGTPVQLEGPFGSFTLHNKVQRPAILLAGGIGITPFRAIVRAAAHQATAHDITLFYGNRRPEDAAFLADLTHQNKNFRLISVMSEPETSASPWSGETGFITRDLLERHTAALKDPARGLQDPIYYLAGPAAMVTALRSVLHAAGVDDDDIRTEEFSGYGTPT